MTVIPKKLRGRSRKSVVQMHRLLEFEKVFDLYLEGKATSRQVEERAKKMLESGLPVLK